MHTPRRPPSSPGTARRLLRILGIAGVAGLVACTAQPGRGRVYQGPSGGAHEGSVGSGGAKDPTSEGAAATDPAADGKVDRTALEGLDVDPHAVGARPAQGEPDPSRRARRRVDEDGDAFFAEKLAAARDAADGGADEQAIEILDGALALAPREPWGERLRALRQDVRARRVETELLRIDVRGVREYVTFGTDVDLVVRMRNVGSADVIIQPPSGSGKEALSGSTLSLAIRRRDRDVYAAELTRSWTQQVPLVESGDAEIRIPPEGTFEVRVRIPAEEAGDPIAGLRVLEVGGDLRAGRVEAGLSEPLGKVRIRTGRVVVLPAGYEPLAEDPVGSMRKAATTVAPVHLLVATEFLAAAERPAAMAILGEVLTAGSPDLGMAAMNAVHHLRTTAAHTALAPLAEPLLRAMRAHPERAEAGMDALTALSGVSLAPDVRLWEDWWRREGSAPSGRVPSDEDLAARNEKRNR
jgi:hypothetical protein